MSDKWNPMVLMPTNPNSFRVCRSFNWSHVSGSDYWVCRDYTGYFGFTGLFLALLSLLMKNQPDFTILLLHRPILISAVFPIFYPSI